MTIRVAVIDDFSSQVGGIEAILAKDPRLECALATTSARDLFSFLDEGNAAEVVVLDLRMPDIDGWEVLARFQARARAPRVVVFTALLDPDAAVDARSLGASGFVLKQDADATLVNAILRAAEDPEFHTVAWPMALLESRAAARRGANAETDSISRLTAREFEVFKLIPAHLGGTKEIAVRLGITASTVEKHLASIRRKLGMNSNELFRYALLRASVP